MQFGGVIGRHGFEGDLIAEHSAQDNFGQPTGKWSETGVARELRFKPLRTEVKDMRLIGLDI
jgi:hypothetical protein